jgi:hypothetical protein
MRGCVLLKYAPALPFALLSAARTLLTPSTHHHQYSALVFPSAGPKHKTPFIQAS